MSTDKPSVAGSPGNGGLTPHELVDASSRLRDNVGTVARPPRRKKPQRFDESGYPIRRGRASLTARVRRLLRG